MTESGSVPLGTLAEASALVEGAQHQLMTGDSPPVRAAIDGIHQIASALTNIIGTVIASVEDQGVTPTWWPICVPCAAASPRGSSY